MRSAYLGGCVKRTTSDDVLSRAEPSEDGLVTSWQHEQADWRLYLHASGGQVRLFEFTDLALLIRGYVVTAGVSEGTPKDIAEMIQHYYRENGRLPIDRLEGAFTLVLMDAKAGRLLLYRNLIGNGFTYYSETKEGLLFGTNLAELVSRLNPAPGPNRDVIPVFFLYRFVPGRQTLFDGVNRLAPGELLLCDANGVRVTQCQTFRDLEESKKTTLEAVDRLEETMAQVMEDCAAFDPQAAVLLSGGVDSSYVQVHWSRTVASFRGAPMSFSVSLDHPRTLPDRQYALSAAELLGSPHTDIPLDRSYPHYLVDAIASTGEPPNHVQSVYFAHLARCLRDRGVHTGLTGEGADSLFGTEWVGVFNRARRLRRLLPIVGLRVFLGALSGTMGRTYWATAFRLANHIGNLTCQEHPVNQINAFTHWPSIRQCFGQSAIDVACAYRRRLLSQFTVQEHPLECTHGIGLLGDAMESAALWTTHFNNAGGCLLCPFLDSRMLRLAVNVDPSYRYPALEPKGVLKRALCRHVPPSLAYRQKRGFGQPIFEWMSDAAELRRLLDAIADYHFVRKNVLEKARAQPNWFLYSLLCYDIWHKMFVSKTWAYEDRGLLVDKI